MKITSIERISDDKIKICSKTYRTKYPMYEDIYLARIGEDTVELIEAVAKFQPFSSSAKKEPSQ